MPNDFRRDTLKVPVPSPRSRSYDDPEQVRAQDQMETELTQTLRRARQLEEELKAQVAEAKKHNSSAPPAKGFSLKIGDLDGAAKLVIAVTSLAALIIGLFNLKEKAADPKVDAVVKNVAAQQARIEGPESEGGLARRVDRLELQMRILEARRCPERQFLAQVFARLGAVGIKPQGCPNELDPLEVDENLGLPGRSGRRSFVVHTPMP